MKKLLIAAAAAILCGVVSAKLPAPVLDDAAKAKAAETAARAAWQAKMDAYLLCKAQDRVAAVYRKTKGAAAPAATPTGAAPVSPGPAPVAAAGPGPGTTSSPTPALPPTAKPAALAASAAPTTPVAGTAPAAACMDPGVFAYNPPEQKPLETSGAHSPSGTAASPPSVRPESAKMAPAKKS